MSTTSSTSKGRKGKQCASYGCTNRFYDANGEPTGLHFFQVPTKSATRRDHWCTLVGRRHGVDGFRVSGSTVLCEQHFRQEDIKRGLGGRWTLRQGTTPKKHDADKQTAKDTYKRPPPRTRSEPTRKSKKRKHPTNSSNVHPRVSDAEAQTDLKMCDICEKTLFQNTKEDLETIEKECERLKQQQFSLDKIKDDDSAVLFYTGFQNYNALLSFYLYIAPKLAKMQYWRGEKSHHDQKTYQTDETRQKPGPQRKLNHLDELFIVLLRLKAGLFIVDLASRFDISTSLVSKICITWINLLYFELIELFPFPSQKQIRKNLPKEFAESFPTTRIILDCTEVFIQRPSAMLAQSETWSDYKHHNTWKALVGISPNGQVTFVSPLWGGRASDKLITKASGVLQKLQPGDNVMVDRGFEIQNICPPQVTVNIPPFLSGRAQLTAQETDATMKIASLRIHVERAIGRIKNYHILDGTLPNTLSPYATQIFTVCAYFTNFLPPLLYPAMEQDVH